MRSPKYRPISKFFNLLVDEYKLDPSVNHSCLLSMAAEINSDEILQRLLKDPRVDSDGEICYKLLEDQFESLGRTFSCSTCYYLMRDRRVDLSKLKHHIPAIIQARMHNILSLFFAAGIDMSPYMIFLSNTSEEINDLFLTDPIIKAMQEASKVEHKRKLFEKVKTLQ
jgi:hypothetical protein